MSERAPYPTSLRSADELAKLDRVRSRQSPFAMSIEELAGRQIAMNNRRKLQGGVAFARKVNTAEKNIARAQVLRLFKTKRWPRGLSILTMPGLYWTFEHRLLSAREGNWRGRIQPARSTHITAVEIDPGIYAAAMASMPCKPSTALVTHLKSPMWTGHATGSDAVRRYYNCDVFALMRHNEKPFGAAWLDFTGPMSPARLEDIREFYKKWVEGILVVTFLAARHGGDATLEIEESTGIQKWLAEYLPGKCLHFLRYQDGASPMAQYAVKKRGFKGWSIAGLRANDSVFKKVESA